MSLTDYVWLTFAAIGLVCALAIAVDECRDAYKRSKTGEVEDWDV